MRNTAVFVHDFPFEREVPNPLLSAAVRGYGSALSALILVICFLDFANYLNLINRAFLPKYIYIAIAIAAAPIFLLRWKSVFRYLGTYPALWFVSFAVLDLIHWRVHSAFGNAAAAELTMTRVEFLLLAVVFGFILTQSRPQFLARCLVSVAILLTILQIIDFTMPGVVVPVDAEGVIPGRAASTLLNANKAAESLALLFVFGAPVLHPKRRLWLFALVLAGVFVTFSRSGIMVMFMILGYGFFFRLVPRRDVLISVALAIAVAVVAGGVLMSDLFRFVDFSAMENIQHRLSFFSSADIGDSSAGERMAVVVHALESFIEHPFFGNGSGYTSFWDFSDVGPHNQQALVLAEYGMIGYAMFVILLVLMFRGGTFFNCLGSRRFHGIAILVFLMFTLFTHNMFDFFYWLLSILLICHRGFPAGTAQAGRLNRRVRSH